MMALEDQQGFIFREVLHKEKLVWQGIMWVTVSLLSFQEGSDVVISMNVFYLLDDLSGFELLIGHSFEKVLAQVLNEGAPYSLVLAGHSPNTLVYEF
jgi:hypothetical protein